MVYPFSLKCNKSGSDSDIIKICKSGEICTGGACKVCVPGFKKCLGSKAVTCKDNGSGNRGGPKGHAKPTVGRGDLCHSLSFNRGVRPSLGRTNQEHQPF